MEQIKLNDGTIREIYKIENNIHMTPAVLRVSFLNKDIAELETVFENKEKTETIYLCDSAGGTMAVFRNYTVLDNITKLLNQQVGQTDPEYDSEGNITVESQTIYGDIVTVTLKQADLQDQLNALKAENQALKQSQDIQDGAILEIAEMLSTEETVTEGGE